MDGFPKILINCILFPANVYKHIKNTDLKLIEQEIDEKEPIFQFLEYIFTHPNFKEENFPEHFMEIILRHFLSDNFDFNSHFFIEFSKFLLKSNHEIETPISFHFFEKVFSIIYQKYPSLKQFSIHILSELIQLKNLISPYCLEFFL